MPAWGPSHNTVASETPQLVPGSTAGALRELLQQALRLARLVEVAREALGLAQVRSGFLQPAAGAQRHAQQHLRGVVLRLHPLRGRELDDGFIRAALGGERLPEVEVA